MAAACVKSHILSNSTSRKKHIRKGERTYSFELNNERYQVSVLQNRLSRVWQYDPDTGKMFSKNASFFMTWLDQTGRIKSDKNWFSGLSQWEIKLARLPESIRN